MDNIVNPHQPNIGERIIPIGGDVQYNIVPFLFDTKMVILLDGGGGASRDLCTASDEEIKSINWIHSGFPSNRSINDARQYFNDVNENVFLKHPTKQRLGIVNPHLT
ncbi:hypothetical protein LOD99_15118 [Oopsacas minuta]|uniref:Uncharacterized protein n=1 Tax=Oopsacas minuta TaxID=111878 RepID=A0AAV7KD37_9METZ|nr:hypothetical protein LOD99_15118 [Oopsacas minuta]